MKITKNKKKEYSPLEKKSLVKNPETITHKLDAKNTRKQLKKSHKN